MQFAKNHPKISHKEMPTDSIFTNSSIFPKNNLTYDLFSKKMERDYFNFYNQKLTVDHMPLLYNEKIKTSDFIGLHHHPFPNNKDKAPFIYIYHIEESTLFASHYIFKYCAVFENLKYTKLHSVIAELIFQNNAFHHLWANNSHYKNLTFRKADQHLSSVFKLKNPHNYEHSPY